MQFLSFDNKSMDFILKYFCCMTLDQEDDHYIEHWNSHSSNYFTPTSIEIEYQTKPKANIIKMEPVPIRNQFTIVDDYV